MSNVDRNGSRKQNWQNIGEKMGIGECANLVDRIWNLKNNWKTNKTCLKHLSQGEGNGQSCQRYKQLGHQNYQLSLPAYSETWPLRPLSRATPEK